MTLPGLRDYSTIRITRHALERFRERFDGDPDFAAAEKELRGVLRRTRRLGRNPETGAIAVLAARGERALVAILQDASCLTVLTWNQFLPRLAEFGRPKLPRKRGRLLGRLIHAEEAPDLETARDPEDEEKPPDQSHMQK